MLAAAGVQENQEYIVQLHREVEVLEEIHHFRLDKVKLILAVEVVPRRVRVSKPAVLRAAKVL
jgi:hypothetical protein